MHYSDCDWVGLLFQRHVNEKVEVCVSQASMLPLVSGHWPQKKAEFSHSYKSISRVGLLCTGDEQHKNQGCHCRRPDLDKGEKERGGLSFQFIFAFRIFTQVPVIIAKKVGFQCLLSTLAASKRL